MTLQGKSMMIWKVSRCEGGNPQAIASAAQAAGLSCVLLKIADGPKPYNIDGTPARDQLPALVEALRAKGLQVWGWHYVYGYNPQAEAQVAIQRMRELALDGYVINAEAEYKQTGKKQAAKTFMDLVRPALANTPIALTSYRWPSYHPQLPWREFLEKCDLNMPQVYWQSAHNPDSQLRRTLREFQALVPYRPIIPIGPMYKYGSWEPTPADISEFMETAEALNLAGVCFFEWYYARTILSPLWNTLSAYTWSPSLQPIDFPAQLIQAYNQQDYTRLYHLYHPDAVHINPDQTVQGHEGILRWYHSFFVDQFPSGKFTLTGASGNNTNRTFTWSAQGAKGSIMDGNDTLGILQNRISYHYSYYSIRKPK